METPIPTPFDIISPGPGPLVPTSLAWVLLLAFGLLGAGIALVRSRRPGPAKIYRALQRLLHEIKQVANKCSSTSDLERIIRLSKRILSPYLDGDAASLTSTELKALSQSYKSRHQVSSDAIAASLAALADLEDLTYAPNDYSQLISREKELTASLVSRLESLIREVKPI